MRWRSVFVVPAAAALLSALLAPAALASGEVQVLRARRDLASLGTNGNGGTISRAAVIVDLAVENLAYDKRVGVRYTTDGWKSFADALAGYVRTMQDGREHWRVRFETGQICENAMIGLGRGTLGPAFCEFAAFYEAGGRSYWDNASDRNHAVAIAAPNVAPLPEVRRQPSCAIVDGTLYLVGGRSNQSYNLVVPDVLRLERFSGTWTKVADIPAAPSAGPGSFAYAPEIWVGYHVVAAGSRIHLIGGSAIKVGGDIRAHFALDPRTGAFASLAALPAPGFGRAAVAAGGEIHLVPLARDSSAQDGRKVLVYDIARDSWTASDVSGLARLAGTEYATAAQAGKLYYFGGMIGDYGSRTSLDQVLVYDPATRTIAERPTCPYPILSAGAKAAPLGDERIAIANSNPDLGAPRSELLVYEPALDLFTWVENGPFFEFDSILAAAPALLISDGAGSRTLETVLSFGRTTGVDTVDPSADLVARGVRRTVIRLAHDVGFGNRVTLRGSAPPLSWFAGADCAWTPGNVWVYQTTDLVEEWLSFKPLLNDWLWRGGSDLQVENGGTAILSGWN